MGRGAPWVVQPGQRVGEFILGMGVNEALATVQRMGSLDAAEFSFDEHRLFDMDLSLRLPALGVQMCFDAFQQDLRVIVVTLRSRGPAVKCAEEGAPEDGCDSLAMLPPLAYMGQPFGGMQQRSLSIRELYDMFGLTWIGEFRSGPEAAYLLQYRGLTFEFPLPEGAVEELEALGEQPMELPHGEALVACRMWVYAGDSASFLEPAPALPDMPPEHAVVRPATGVELGGRLLRFGSMPQDVFSDFGPPEQVCVKDAVAVRMHSAGAAPSLTSGPDYYYNYFRLGLDVLFDGQTHLMKKVILHTNPPTHEFFSRYSRCFYQLPIALSAAHNQDSSSPERTCASGEGPRVGPSERPAPVEVSPTRCRGDMDLSAASGELLATSVGADVAEPVPHAPGAEAPASEGQGSELADGVPPAAAVGEGDDCGGDMATADAEAGAGSGSSRRMSKKERKAARKSRASAARAPLGSPHLGASPDWSALSSSVEPSPLLDLLDESAPGGLSAGGGRESVDDRSADISCLEELPPPVLPLDSAQGAELALADMEPDGLPAELAPTEDEQAKESGDEAEGQGDRQLCIDVRWPWTEIQRVLGAQPGCDCSKPPLLNMQANSPFGSTYFYVFPGLAFEVMQNDFVASLIVFSVPTQETGVPWRS